ncbi:hypothetical protein H696_00730 [Fonticula alba]|uniref:Uncharacterized protein n=1 Tax=Fonticula alba TaxID=691883 RepID=A0A058ZI36_FONAL|nr:hypothetical protein H696_00730 [Fonticula alba]KCV73187.1 hypothetical protein H696_00730 [Fonticula alba]|eukprot:XP_009492888.1 hypothetical protein H696_00730 [Fonticula alba]
MPYLLQSSALMPFDEACQTFSQHRHAPSHFWCGPDIPCGGGFSDQDHLGSPKHLALESLLQQAPDTWTIEDCKRVLGTPNLTAHSAAAVQEIPLPNPTITSCDGEVSLLGTPLDLPVWVYFWRGRAAFGWLKFAPNGQLVDRGMWMTFE